MVQDRRLLWHPRHDTKFIVGGGAQITLYEWAPDLREIRPVTSQNDLNFMKCFAWSPDPLYDDLVAVGLSTGTVDLLRLEATKYARRRNVLPSGPTVSLPVRNSRACNALAFNNVNPNYLAVGLDKVRGDSSLIIWDISSASSTLSLPGSSTNSSPVTVDSSPSRLRQQIPRVDNHPRSDSRIVQQHAPTEIVSSLAFLPSSSYLLLAGISHRWLRLFDLRSATANVINVASKIHGIATDPFDTHRIACFGDRTITVWDTRKLSQPTLMFTEKDANGDGALARSSAAHVIAAYANLEFSSTRRGCLASLERDSTFVRLWSILDAKLYVPEVSGTVSTGSLDSDHKNSLVRTARKSWAATMPWASGSHPSSSNDRVAAGLDTTITSVAVLASTLKTQNLQRPLASFALVPNSPSHSVSSNVMVIDKDGGLELVAVYDAPKQALWSARGDLAIAAGVGLKVIEGFHGDGSAQDDAAGGHRQPSIVKQSMERTSHKSMLGKEEPVIRGRTRKISAVMSSTRARGERDVFQSAGGTANTTPTGLTASRPGKSRTFSPVSVRTLGQGDPFEHLTSGKRRSPSRTDTVPAHDIDQGTQTENHGPGGPESSVTIGRRGAKNNKNVSLVVEDDISMIMRARARASYGLSVREHNVSVVQDDRQLLELWTWIYHSHELLGLPTSRIHGFDFAHQGLIGIWEGLSPSFSREHVLRETNTPPLQSQRSLLFETSALGVSHSVRRSRSTSTANRGNEGPRTLTSHSPSNDHPGKWQEALGALAARKLPDKFHLKSRVLTAKPTQRQLALQLCGWGLREEELLGAIKRWEKEGNYARAACWLVLTREYKLAVDLLMRSDDDALRMMSGTIAALLPYGPSQKSLELRDHCERLAGQLRDPYMRVMLTHLALGDWFEVLERDLLPFRERLAIAFQFLDDATLTSYLRRTAERASTQGDIDALIVTGLTKTGLNVIQAYVDRTGDVQTAALLSSYICPHVYQDPRAERWLEAYRDLLDGFKLHHIRVRFDIERGQILGQAVQSGDALPEDWVPRQILIRCSYCSKPVSNPPTSSAAQPPKGRPTTCANCQRALPRCSVCLMTLSIVHDATRELEHGRSHYRDTIDEAIVICQTCRHGGHAAHVLDWFLGGDAVGRPRTCPVADCDCRCADEF